jgi:transcriptional repressor NrdR
VKCPQCGFDDTKVLESRLSHEGRSVRRRRSCIQCNYRFTTYEKEEEFVFQIVKKDGRIEPYQRSKTIRSLEVACSKRPISMVEIEEILDRIERAIQESGERIVPSQKLGDLIMERLHERDKVAYVRFASVYKDFKDPDEFLAELKGLS